MIDNNITLLLNGRYQEMLLGYLLETNMLSATYLEVAAYAR
ncbi:hypothetical protein SDC9_142464 [bioreactor metagenome]|uniref:Uncharacterized protein n=1 Tax=bioreactor metagenome TaxID=1076179 RepID=A0A645E0K2_9ZZZZ